MLVLPPLAHAGTFSFISSLLGGSPSATSAAAPALNSQTVPLLSAVVNADPNAAVGGGDITVVDGSALQPDQGPTGAGADLGGSQYQNSQISVYTVRDGDTLSTIAAMFKVNTQTIIGANNIKGGVIHPGQTLIILPIIGTQYTTVKGDTLASIAKAYGSDADDIASYNGLDTGASFAAGTTLIIPNGEAKAVVSSGSTATKSTTTTKAKTTATTSHAKVIAKIAIRQRNRALLGRQRRGYPWLLCLAP